MFHCSYSMPLTWLKARSHNPNGLFVGGEQSYALSMLNLSTVTRNSMQQVFAIAMSFDAVAVTAVGQDSARPFSPERYSINVSDAVLSDLKERLTRTRWPDRLPGTGTESRSPRASRRIEQRWGPSTHVRTSVNAIPLFICLDEVSLRSTLCR